MSRKFLIEFPFEIVWGRLSEKLSLKNYSELVDIIGISQPVISKRKKENIFPVEWAYIISKKKDLPIDWILEGKGPKRPSDQKSKKLELDCLQTFEKWIKEKESDKPAFPNWIEIELDRNFPEFEEWKRKIDKDREDSSIQEANIA